MASLESLLRSVHRLAGKHPLLVGGDFNSQHTDWGYKTTTHRGRRLWLLLQNLHLTVHNFLTPTRIGNSVSMDTSPDLVLTHSLRGVTWTRTQHTLGSDHYIIQVTVPYKQPRHTYMTHKLINWDSFRATRAARSDTPISDIDTWVKSLQDDVQCNTKLIETPTETPTLDTRLAHLWEAYHSLLERWKRNKLNRTLKKRLAALQTEIQQHSEELCRSNWGQICDGIAGNLSTKRAWQLLRHLIDPMQTKTATQHHVTKLVDAHKDNPDRLIDTLQRTYTSPGIPTCLPPYTGQANPTLDTDITETEVRAALLTLRTSSAPGADQKNPNYYSSDLVIAAPHAPPSQSSWTDAQCRRLKPSEYWDSISRVMVKTPPP
ncbi:uncharacterized protein [Dermacentor albipictus]|uniref:uncharacterized protein n=1 Tax=Dermacentor albipictus TaxID=60249 RepID=UPI0038FCBFEA